VPTVDGQTAFVPADLPAKLAWTPELVVTLSDANLWLGQLRGVGLNIPNPNLLITPFARLEAEMSSRIEGTQAEVKDIYLFEMHEAGTRPEVPDVREVSNYVRALDYGLKRCGQLPVCLRMIRDLHAKLLEGVQGEVDRPGEFRTDQNWIGSRGCPITQARYVPPPPEQLSGCLDAFERFVNAPLGELPVLVWLAMVHYQFEAIHPFRDGNGRIGRLLMILLLCSKGVLDKPLLYLSAYFERNCKQYYERLLRVSTHGEWAEWISFFLRGVVEQSKDAFDRSRQLLELQRRYHDKVNLWRSALGIKMVDLLIERPVVSIALVSKYFSVTYVTARDIVANFVKDEILKEVTGRKRYRIYMAEEVLKVINKPFDVSHSSNG
jgi:Fic family protein